MSTYQSPTHTTPLRLTLTATPYPDSELATARTAFSLKFNSALWVMTTGLQFFIGWWFRKAAVFYLPPGWFGPLTWWLALPFAPTGSVSCGVWQMACRRVIKVGERVVREVMSPSPSSSASASATSSGESVAHLLVSGFLGLLGRSVPSAEVPGKGGFPRPASVGGRTRPASLGALAAALRPRGWVRAGTRRECGSARCRPRTG